MNIFKNEWEKYQQAKLPVVPLEGKNPEHIGIGWQLKDWLDPETARPYMNGKSYNLGLPLGKYSGIVALDLDSTVPEENNFIENKMREYCNPIYGKKGMKGNNFYFKWSSELQKELDKKGKNFKSINVQILSTGLQTVMPPSIHPDTKEPYIHIGKPIYQLDLEQLPEFPLEFLDWLKRENDSRKKEKKEKDFKEGKKTSYEFGSKEKGRCRHNSHITLSSILTARMERGESIASTIEELLKVDLENNVQEGEVSYFLCPSRKEFRFETREENAKCLVEDYIKRHNSKNPDFSLKDLLENSHWVFNVQSQTSEFFLVNKGHKKIEKIAERFLVKTFGKYKLMELAPKNTRSCFFFYSPLHKQFEIRKGVEYFNQYVPPKWKEALFWENEPVPVSKNLPEDFDKYLTHITGNNESCKTWLIHWLANSVQGRNKNALLLISETRGTGKTLLFEIMRLVHGETNSYLCSDRLLKNNFNGQVREKTLVCVDEVYLKTPEAFNNLKGWTNDFMAFENKGVDESMGANHANLIICSNKFKAVPLHEDNRQFSVIEVPEKELTECAEFSSMELIKDKLLSEDTTREIAQFLFSMKIDHSILQFPFRGEKAEEISNLTRPEWHNFVSGELHQDLLENHLRYEQEGMPDSDICINESKGVRFVDYNLSTVREKVNGWVDSQRDIGDKYRINNNTLKLFLNSRSCRDLYGAKRFSPSNLQTPNKNVEIVRVFLK